MSHQSQISDSAYVVAEIILDNKNPQTRILIRMTLILFIVI